MNKVTAESRERDSAVTLFGPGDYCALTKKLFYMLSVKLSDEKCDKWYRRFYYNLRLQMQEYYQHKAVIMDSYWNHHMEKSYGEADEV